MHPSARTTECGLLSLIPGNASLISGTHTLTWTSLPGTVTTLRAHGPVLSVDHVRYQGNRGAGCAWTRHSSRGPRTIWTRSGRWSRTLARYCVAYRYERCFIMMVRRANCTLPTSHRPGTALLRDEYARALQSDSNGNCLSILDSHV
eukprot:225033-Rhodomonas_salina.17